ncbi:acyl carrier protein [Streptomyces sp. NPDC018000]|uniref:acyl carrier protein n=1 Tax=Streptomyces sp. NPDC018000 TaxID=3365028 RepID=UPI0037901BB9
METETPRTAAELGDWLTRTVADYLRCDPAEIEPDVPLSDYGLDSISATTVCADIEDNLGLPVEVTLIWDHPTIDKLSQALAEELETAVR